MLGCTGLENVLLLALQCVDLLLGTDEISFAVLRHPRAVEEDLGVRIDHVGPYRGDRDLGADESLFHFCSSTFRFTCT